MSDYHVQAYEGNEPYVFISYAHKDSAVIYQILRELDQRGVRLWYDDGIAPGSEWPDYIADHLLRASAVVAFITDNSAQSANCRREITFALSKNKPFISVFPSYVSSLSSGLELQLSAQQSVFRQNCKDEEAFIDKIVSTPFIIPCLRRPEPQVHAVAVSVLNPDSDVARREEIAKNKAQLEADRKAAEEARKAALAAEKAARRQQAAAEGKKPKKWLIPVIIAAALILCSTIGIFVFRSLQVKICGKSYVSSITTLSIYDETITAKDIAQIERLKKLSSLSCYNCTFEGNCLAEFDAPEPLYSFRLDGCIGVSDLSFLPACSNLSNLNLLSCALTDDLLPDLSRLKIYQLDIRDNPDISVLPSLMFSNLTQLNIAGTAISDISPLSGASKLTNLTASYCPITNLSPLTSLTGLSSLILDHTLVTSYTDDIEALEIQYLDFTGAPITNASAFENQTVLYQVSFAYTPIEDLSFLPQSSATLISLNLHGCSSLDLSDIEPLNVCTSLKELYMSNIDLSGSDLSFVRDMASLQYLSVIHCGLTDISGIGSHPNLSSLRLSLNEIKDISPLTGITESTDFNLDLAFNQIENASPLGLSYHCLSLAGNPISQMAFLAEGEYSRYILLLDYFDGLENVTDDPGYTWIYLYGTPKSLQVSMKDRNYSYSFCATRVEQLEGIASYFSYDPWKEFIPE